MKLNKILLVGFYLLLTSFSLAVCSAAVLADNEEDVSSPEERTPICPHTESGALLIEALARSNDQQLAGAIIFMLTATIVFLNFITDILLALVDPRVWKSVMGGG